MQCSIAEYNPNLEEAEQCYPFRLLKPRDMRESVGDAKLGPLDRGCKLSGFLRVARLHQNWGIANHGMNSGQGARMTRRSLDGSRMYNASERRVEIRFKGSTEGLITSGSSENVEGFMRISLTKLHIQDYRRIVETQG